jgi:hypothetical protein
VGQGISGTLGKIRGDEDDRMGTDCCGTERRIDYEGSRYLIELLVHIVRGERTFVEAAYCCCCEESLDSLA